MTDPSLVAPELVDAVLGEVLTRALQGEMVATVDRPANAVSLPSLHPEHAQFLASWFDLSAQQARGAWFLPDTVDVNSGVLSFPGVLRTYGRFGGGMVFDWVMNCKVPSATYPHALFLWALVQPIMTILALPIRIRTKEVGLKSTEWQRERDREVRAMLRTLGLDENAALRLEYGKGWSRLTAAERQVVREDYCRALARSIPADLGIRARSWSLQTLDVAYEQGANKDGKATRKKIVSTTPTKQALCGVFGGDWMAYLRYRGVAPHPQEEVVTALPEPSLALPTAETVERVARHFQHVPREQLDLIFGTFWERQGGVSPIDERLEVLQRFWREFDGIHAAQQSGMSALWGLVEESGHLNVDGVVGPKDFHPGLYRSALSCGLQADIERLWATRMFGRWPERLITEMFPHALMAETFGPALRFWHGVALTTWFLCAGPASRTDLPGMRAYYRREVKALAEAGTPVDPALFDDLVAAESLLGPPQPIAASARETEEQIGVILSVVIYTGVRRDGFESLRDIVTCYRRVWADQYLTAYLQARLRLDLEDVHWKFHRIMAQKSRVPTAKELGGAAEKSANRWFGGDISGVCRAIGEAPPVQPLYHRKVPERMDILARGVYERMERALVRTQQENTGTREKEVRRLAERTPLYFQLLEALDAPPSPAQFGRADLERSAGVLETDCDALWLTYVRSIEECLASPTS